MPSGQREALTGLISMLIVIVIFVLRLADQHAAGAFAGPEALQVWARSVLILIGISIGVAIAVSIAAHVLQSALTGEAPDDRKDERDHLIDRRALTWGWYLLSIGILGVIVDLAMGASGFRAMNLVLALCFASEALKDSVRLWLYRHGG